MSELFKLPVLTADEPAADQPRCRAPEASPSRPDRFGTRLEDLEWIDEFIAKVREFIRVRPEDGVLIKVPTEVYPLNPAALTLLRRVLDGERIRDVAVSLGAADHPERLWQIHTFFCDVRDLLAERLGDGRGRPTTRVTRFTGSFTRYPVLSEIAVTYRCNLACQFCYAGCGTPSASPGNPLREKHPDRWKLWRRTKWWRRRHPRRDPLRDEMSADEVFQVIDQIALVGKVPSVSFTGGECTLRPELPEFIRHARDRGMRVNIITNGIACASPTYVRRLADAGLNSAQVSLEGPTAAIHDGLTQRPGSFAQTIRGIENLRDEGIRVHTNTTICQQNADHLTAIIDLAHSLGLPRVSMNHVIPTGTANLSGSSHTWMPYTRIGQYVMRAKRHAEAIGLAFHWYSPTPFCLFNPIAHGLGNKGCAACDGLIHVSPCGDVLPCSSFATSVGNILDEGLERVWFGRAARYYKRKRQAPRLCRLCPDFALCQGACTLYWSSTGQGELYRAVFRRLAGGLARRLRRDC
ncbi:MAG: radical SAM protein [Planctomycetes bacterium]|nr:radical SAM protein [Planctomycetota bacterium]